MPASLGYYSAVGPTRNHAFALHPEVCINVSCLFWLFIFPSVIAPSVSLQFSLCVQVVITCMFWRNKKQLTDKPAMTPGYETFSIASQTTESLSQQNRWQPFAPVYTFVVPAQYERWIFHLCVLLSQLSLHNPVFFQHGLFLYSITSALRLSQCNQCSNNLDPL